MKRLLITICGRAGSKGFKNKNLKNFCGKPLVYYSLSAAELFIKKHPELEIDVALNTDSENLARLVAAEYPEVIYLPRGAELGGDRVPKVEVYKDSFARMEAHTGKQYDAMIDLDITSPLRTEQDIENAFAKAQEREDLQIIFSVCEARRNPWFNMFKIVGDHAEMVIESQFHDGLAHRNVQFHQQRIVGNCSGARNVSCTQHQVHQRFVFHPLEQVSKLTRLEFVHV